jgi:hypothetical protein
MTLKATLVIECAHMGTLAFCEHGMCGAAQEKETILEGNKVDDVLAIKVRDAGAVVLASIAGRRHAHARAAPPANQSPRCHFDTTIEDDMFYYAILRHCICTT